MKYVSRKENCEFIDLCCEAGKIFWEMKGSLSFNSRYRKSKDIIDKINAKVLEAKRHGYEYPLERLIKEFKLDDKERLLLYFILFKAAGRGNKTFLSEELLHWISGSYSEFLLSKEKYFSPSSPLVKKEIILPARNPWNDSFTISQSFIQRVLILKGRKHNPPNESSKNKLLNKIFSPKEIYDALSEVVIGQEEAKKAVAATAHHHYQLIKINHDKRTSNLKPSILLIGPTGAGKTYLIRNLAKLLKVPVVFCDMSEYTDAGYVGKSVSEVAHLLLERANGDKFLAEHGIVFLDEIDKIVVSDIEGGHYSRRDVSGRAVQEELLSLLDSSGEKDYYPDGYRSYSKTALDMRGVLFIAAGVFEGLNKIVARRCGRTKRIGFHNGGEVISFNQLPRATAEDLIQYGFIPELVGRFSTIIELNRLSETDLYRVLSESKESPCRQYTRLFRGYGIELSFTDDGLREIARRSFDIDTGGRALTSVMEEIMRPLLFGSSDLPRRLVINAGFVNNPDPAFHKGKPLTEYSRERGLNLKG